MAETHFILGQVKQDKKYTCDTCKKSYKVKGTLTRHIVYECSKIPQNQCPVCLRKYIRRDTLLRHMKFECTGKLRFFCNHCGYGTVRKSHMIHHLQTRHAFGKDLKEKIKFTKKDRLFNCAKCGNNYLRRESYLRHTKFECGKGPQFFCTECNYSCKRRGHLTQHAQVRHNIALFLNDTSRSNQQDQKAVHKCAKCLKIFTTRKGMNYHLKNVKCKELAYSCALCDFNSKQSESELNEHMKTAHNMSGPIDAKKPVIDLICKACDKVFKTKKGYLYHVKNVCGQQTHASFSCPQCDFTAKLKSDLEEHMDTHENDVVDNSCDKSIIGNLTELYKCPTCDQRLASDMDLEIHKTMCEEGSGRGQEMAVEQHFPIDNSRNQTNQEILVSTEKVKPVDEAHNCVTCGKKFAKTEDFQHHTCEKLFISSLSRTDYLSKPDLSLENSITETLKNENLTPVKKMKVKRKKIKMLMKKSESQCLMSSGVNADRENKARYYCQQCDFSSKSRSHYHKHVTLKHNIRNVYELEIR
ncbi:zinc finger protein 845-like [Phymastichus coffea]|uniref:zinc finger protein 845-like n=1 Tax=Phymastichus coffea TaxID=108790 RepID=UPI00273CE7EC|nr:zinc finger protein 845-like [Phymastichus coffea]